MTPRNFNRAAMLSLAATASTGLFVPPFAHAQAANAQDALTTPPRADAPPASTSPPASDALKLQPVLVSGTRFSDRVIADSLAPIDVVSVQELQAAGHTDLPRMIKARVPTFSLPNSVGAGTVEFVSF